MPPYSLAAVARPFVHLVERWYPDAYVFAIALTFVTLALAVALTDTAPLEAVDLWGAGLSGLLAFTTQIALTLVFAHALAHTDAAQRLLSTVAHLPRSAFAAYGTVAVATSAASLVAWSLGLAAGALLAREVARTGAARGLALDYPLLVASAYSGFVVWHMGYSGSAPLAVATPGHALEATTGLLPVTETILAPWNLAMILAVVPIVALTCALMAPASPTRFAPEPQPQPRNDDLAHTPGQRMERARMLSFAVGALAALWLARHFLRAGPALDLNVVNWSFLAAGLLLARSPLHYVQLVTNAGATLGPILLQYPFYAGIMGLMTGSGLVVVFSDFFVAFASAETLSFWAFLCGGVVNFFVPSGGGQWVVQGPVFVDAAARLGASVPEVVMGIAYGDQWSNLIQPFWTIPLLAIAGLPMRRVLGYTFVTFLVSGIAFGAGLLLIGAL
ncbi:MAG: TIGR00366 family protein [Pseudomonadales bacterium]|nr:TIGR00366 family protein [Pseudomonadales bacterium]